LLLYKKYCVSGLTLACVTLLILLFFQASAECRSPEDSAFLWLEYGAKKDETDGSVTQTIYITTTAAVINLAEMKDLSAYYCDGRQTGEKQYYRIPIEQRDGRYFLRVNAASQLLYHVFVTGSCQGEHFVAQTIFPLYADGIDRKRDQDLLENPKDLPAIELNLAGNPYRTLTTGQAIQLRYKSGQAVREMQIMDLRNKTSAIILPDAAGGFSFTPSHDKRLDNGGYNEYKEIIVYAEEVIGNEIYKTSMNLLLRRSLTAHNNLAQGVLLFFSVMAVSIAIVLFRRRSFRYNGR